MAAVDAGLLILLSDAIDLQACTSDDSKRLRLFEFPARDHDKWNDFALGIQAPSNIWLAGKGVQLRRIPLLIEARKSFLERNFFSRVDAKMEAKTPVVAASSYNVLANSMATPRRITVAKPEFLSLEFRMPKILQRVKEMTDRRAIIALQEVDVALACAGLSELFVAQGYDVLRAHYSTMPERDGMGNWLAIPLDRYKVLHYGQERIGNYILGSSDPCPPPPNASCAANAYLEAQKRDTTMVFAKLLDRASNHVFFAFNYHMPCTFWWIPVMTLHADALKLRMAHHAGDQSFVLLGDFNEVPGTPLFEFLLNGTITEVLQPSPSWRATSKLPLTELRQALGQEVAAKTCQARDAKGKLFCGALDHVFFRGLVPVSFQSTALGPETELPNDCEPSDHVPVHADFAIPQ
jgi:mRNA deadenylase 3'-5' endonuclease subunit Ccr4